MPNNKHALIALFAVAVFCIGCGAKNQGLSYSGFLGDYSNFRMSNVVEDLHVDKHPTKTLADYDKFLIAPIQVYFHSDAKGVGVDPTKLKELTDAFYEKAVEVLSDHYEVVEEPGEGVLLCRIAVTDVVSNKVALNLHWSTTATGVGIGGAALEADFVDSVTNERILAVIDSRKGKRYKDKKGLTKWGHTKGVFKEWAEMFVERLDELHGITKEESDD